MFDTHTHFNLKPLLGEIDSFINNARSAGVNYFLIPGIDLDTSRKAVEIAQDYKNTFSAVGIHPDNSLQNFDIEKNLVNLEELIEKNKVTAVGEIGLDYYRNTSGSLSQMELFRKQIKIAIKYNKTIIIHSRHATKDTLKVLSEFTNLPATVFHCCEADLDLLKFASENNCFLGCDGDVTYDKNKQDFILKVPLEMLVLETDSPFLTPEPVKSKIKFPNEPSNLKFVAQKIAEIKKESLETVISQTLKNSFELFNI